MQQEIVIRKNQYYQVTEEDNIDKLKIDYHTTSFSTYDPSKPYLHIRVGDYDEFNLYLEMDEYQMEKLIKQLEEQVYRVRYNLK